MDKDVATRRNVTRGNVIVMRKGAEVQRRFVAFTESLGIAGDIAR